MKLRRVYFIQGMHFSQLKNGFNVKNPNEKSPKSKSPKESKVLIQKVPLYEKAKITGH